MTKQSKCCERKPQVTTSRFQILVIRAAHLAELIILDFISIFDPFLQDKDGKTLTLYGRRKTSNAIEFL